jgi:hypothetical protein
MSTQLMGDVVSAYVEAKVRLTAEDVEFVLTVNVEDGSGNIWKYNLSEAGATRNSRVAFGRTIAPDHRAALRQAAAVLGQGYEPGTVERGLFDTLATKNE